MNVSEQRTNEAIQSMNRKMRNQNRIDWEQRKWELASTIFRERLILPDERCSLTLEGDAETAIEFAEVFIETYQRKQEGK